LGTRQKISENYSYKISKIDFTIIYFYFTKMDSLYLHYLISQEYNVRRKPVIEKFIKTYEGEIKYVFSQDYILEVYDTTLRLGLASGLQLSSK